TAGVSNQSRSERGQKHHCDRPRPEVEIHRCRANDITQKNQDRRNKERDLRRTAERNADTQVEVILAGGGKGRHHFRRGADQGDKKQSKKSGSHPEGYRRVLNATKKDFAGQRDKKGDPQKRSNRQSDGPGGLSVLGGTSE